MNFKEEYPELYEKIDDDEALSDDVKKEFFEYMEKEIPNDSTMEAHADAWMKQHKLVGPNKSLSEKCYLGRVQEFASTVKKIAHEAKIDIKSAEDELDDAMARRSFTPMQEAQLQDIEIVRYVMWSCYNPRNFDDPFDNTPPTDLPCRLGLDDAAGKRHIALRLKNDPPIKAHTPTAFDPGIGYLSRWRPGGITHPNNDCLSRYSSGFPEVVSRPITFGAIVALFECA